MSTKETPRYAFVVNQGTKKEVSFRMVDAEKGMSDSRPVTVAATQSTPSGSDAAPEGFVTVARAQSSAPNVWRLTVDARVDGARVGDYYYVVRRLDNMQPIFAGRIDVLEAFQPHGVERWIEDC